MSNIDPQLSQEHDNVIMGNGQPSSTLDIGGVKRPRATGLDDDDGDNRGPNPERRKLEIKFIQDKTRRHITFSKRKAGIMKKAYELSVLTGTQVLLLIVSETGLIYTFTTPRLSPLVTTAEGKNLIQVYLNAPEPGQYSLENGTDIGTPESPEEPLHAAQFAPQQNGRPGPGQISHQSLYTTPEQYLAHQQ